MRQLGVVMLHGASLKFKVTPLRCTGRLCSLTQAWTFPSHLFPSTGYFLYPPWLSCKTYGGSSSQKSGVVPGEPSRDSIQLSVWSLAFEGRLAGDEGQEQTVLLAVSGLVPLWPFFIVMWWHRPSSVSVAALIKWDWLLFPILRKCQKTNKMIYMSSLIKTRCPVNFSYYHFFPVRQELSTCKLDLWSPEVDVFHSKAEVAWH